MHLFTECVLSFSSLLAVHALSPPPLSLRSSEPPDYDKLSFSSSAASSGLVWYRDSGVIPSTGQSYVAHVASFHPSYFSFEPPVAEGCTQYVKTSTSSHERDCEYATNGGFFSWDETLSCKCVGNLISNSKEIILEGMNNANFGITSSDEMVTGFIDETTVSSMNFTQLMSGSGWLVRNGVSYVSSSSDLDVSSNFVVEKAPRTAVGYFSNGTMLLYEVDGEEDIDYGPDLFEMAELLVLLGAESAINIDGGGSSVSVYDGEVISEPTCNDTSEICEREVQSFTCVKK